MFVAQFSISRCAHFFSASENFLFPLLHKTIGEGTVEGRFFMGGDRNFRVRTLIVRCFISAWCVSTDIKFSVRSHVRFIGDERMEKEEMPDFFFCFSSDVIIFSVSEFCLYVNNFIKLNNF